MGIAVPDCTLILDALDKIGQGILNRNTALGFRTQSVRMQLSLIQGSTIGVIEADTTVGVQIMAKP